MPSDKRLNRTTLGVIHSNFGKWGVLFARKGQTERYPFVLTFRQNKSPHFPRAIKQEIMAITARLTTPDSDYMTGHFVSGAEAVITLTLNAPLQEDITQNHIRLWDQAYAREHGPFPVSRLAWRLEKVSDSVYRIRYTSAYPLTALFIDLRHEEISEIRSESRLTVGPPPQDVTFAPEDFFLYNGETTTVAFTVNLRRRRLSINNLSVSAGGLSNFRGSGHNYRVDITAPAEGVGILKLRINSFQDVLIEEFLYAPRPTEDILFLSKKKPAPHLAREDKSVYFQEITASDLDDINDFKVLILFDQDVTGFTENDLTLYAIDEKNDVVSTAVVDFVGKGSVYEATIRVLSSGGAGTVTLNVPHHVTDQGNAEKSLVVSYDDERMIPEWEVMFVTTDTYNDIVSVSHEGVQLLRGNQIDFFSFQGEVERGRQVRLPGSPVVTRAVKYDTDKYLGLATSSVHLFVAGATEWRSASVFTLATDRNKQDTDSMYPQSGESHKDWAWTRDRRVILAASPFENNAAAIGSVHSLEIHKAIREGGDLNDVVFERISLDYGELDIETWNGLVAVAHDEGKLFIGSNETGNTEQNYIFVFDAEHKMMKGQQIPVSGRTKSLFAKNGWLYRYNDSTKTMLRFPLDALRLPEPKKEIYPQIVLPGDAIDLRKFVRFAERVVFDVGFEKPRWVSLDGHQLRIATDTPVKSTAYVRLRAINNTGASVAGHFGFYIYVRELRSPEWKNFDKLSVYHNQELNMYAYLEGADDIEWQAGFTPPDTVELENGKLKVAKQDVKST